MRGVKGEPTKLMRVPTSRVDEVRDLLKRPVGSPEPGAEQRNPRFGARRVKQPADEPAVDVSEPSSAGSLVTAESMCRQCLRILQFPSKRGPHHKASCGLWGKE